MKTKEYRISPGLPYYLDEFRIFAASSEEIFLVDFRHPKKRNGTTNYHLVPRWPRDRSQFPALVSQQPDTMPRIDRMESPLCPSSRDFTELWTIRLVSHARVTAIWTRRIATRRPNLKIPSGNEILRPLVPFSSFADERRTRKKENHEENERARRYGKSRLNGCEI